MLLAQPGRDGNFIQLYVKSEYKSATLTSHSDTFGGSFRRIEKPAFLTVLLNAALTSGRGTVRLFSDTNFPLITTPTAAMPR